MRAQGFVMGLGGEGLSVCGSRSSWAVKFSGLELGVTKALGLHCLLP